MFTGRHSDDVRASDVFVLGYMYLNTLTVYSAFNNQCLLCVVFPAVVC